MNLQKILVPVAMVVGVALAYRYYSWMGVAGLVTLLVFWMLLNFNRTLQVLKRAANRPMGYVESAVMLNAKLKPGMTLLHVVAMTKSLGQLTSVKDAQPEIFVWKDGTESSVTCTFVNGKLTQHELFRPAPDDSASTADAASPAP